MVRIDDAPPTILEAEDDEEGLSRLRPLSRASGGRAPPRAPSKPAAPAASSSSSSGSGGLRQQRYKASKSVTVLQVFSHECLRKNTFFASRSDGFLEEVSGMLRVEVYHAGDIIMEEGSSGDQMFFLHTGSVEVLAKERTERIATLFDGSVFGEMAMFTDGAKHQRTATVRALDFCDCRVIQYKAFSKVLKQFPEDRRYFEKLAQDRQAALSEATEEQGEQSSVGHFRERASIFWHASFDALDYLEEDGEHEEEEEEEDEEEDEEEEEAAAAEEDQSLASAKWTPLDRKSMRVRATLAPRRTVARPSGGASLDPRRHTAAGGMVAAAAGGRMLAAAAGGAVAAAVASSAAAAAGTAASCSVHLEAPQAEDAEPEGEVAASSASGAAAASRASVAPRVASATSDAPTSGLQKRRTVAGPGYSDRASLRSGPEQPAAAVERPSPRSTLRSPMAQPPSAMLPPLLVGRHGERTPQQRREAVPPSIPPPIARLTDLTPEQLQALQQQQAEQQQQQQQQQEAEVGDEAARKTDIAKPAEESGGKPQAVPRSSQGSRRRPPAPGSKKSSRRANLTVVGCEDIARGLPSLSCAKATGFSDRWAAAPERKQAVRRSATSAC